MQFLGSDIQRISDAASAFAGGGAADPLDLAATDAAAPAAGRTRLFRRAVAGRQMPAFIGAIGGESVLQPLLARRKIGIWTPPGDGTVQPAVLGYTAINATGTVTARAVTVGSIMGRMRRLGFVSAATAGSAAQMRVAVAQITTGTTIGGVAVGGFFKVVRFGISDAAPVATARMFVGISATTGTSIGDPATLINSVGVGHGASDTNLKVFYGGSAAQTPIDLGAGFPNTADTAYELALFCAPGSTDISYQVTNLSTGAAASGTLSGGSAVVPQPATLMTYCQHHRTNNTAALAVGLDIMSDYIETDL